MSEFNNRIAAQRRVLCLVNRKEWKEELFGLSGRAIERWRAANDIDPKSPLLGLVAAASSTLFCLATKSQEQISDEYERASEEFERVAYEIEREIT